MDSIVYTQFAPLTTVLNVVQLRAKASAKGVPATPKLSPPILTQSLSKLPAKTMKPEKTITRPKNRMHDSVKRKKKLTRNIQCRYMARAWLDETPRPAILVLEQQKKRRQNPTVGFCEEEAMVRR
jgi:hypothetical protein